MENTKNTPNISCEFIKAHLKAWVDQLIEGLACEICEICSSYGSAAATEHEIAVREYIARLVSVYDFTIGLIEYSQKESGGGAKPEPVEDSSSSKVSFIVNVNKTDVVFDENDNMIGYCIRALPAEKKSEC